MLAKVQKAYQGWGLSLLVVMPQKDGGGCADIERFYGGSVRNSEVGGGQGEVRRGEAFVFATQKKDSRWRPPPRGERRSLRGGLGRSNEGPAGAG